MEKSSVFIEQIKGNVAFLLEKPAVFFEKIQYENEKENWAEIYNCVFENCHDIFFLNHTLKEINKLRDPKNLDTLLDFLLTKSRENFQISNSSLNDFINLRVKIVMAIANYKSTKAVPTLLYCLNSKNEHYKFRLAVAEALGKIGDKNAVDSLINVVSDEGEKSIYVRESAAKALGMIGDLRAIEPFLGILEAKKSFLDKFTFLKERVIEAIGKMEFSQNQRVLSALKNALEDDSSQVRINAIESLSNSNYFEAEELIRTAIFDPDEEVGANACIGLYNMLGKEGVEKLLTKENLPARAREQIQELLEDEDEND